jgi:hypothetical protein
LYAPRRTTQPIDWTSAASALYLEEETSMQRALFDAGWEYTEGSTFFGMLLSPTQPVTLPHDASIGKPRKPDHPSGAGGAYAWNGVVTYRKHFQAPPEWQGQRVQLEFEGVMMHAEVTVNGQLLAMHPYGYTSFLVDLTPYLQYGADNEVVVVANNSAQPNSRWYTGTGLYRHVWLRTGGALHIPPWGVFVTTPRSIPRPRRSQSPPRSPILLGLPARRSCARRSPTLLAPSSLAGRLRW